MANLLRSLRGGTTLPLSLDEWASYLTFGSTTYPLAGGQSLGEKQEEIGSDFRAYVEGAYKANGVVFACMAARLLLFSEARFQFRRMQSGRPGELFGAADLKPLEEPWPGATTGDLLGRMIQDADLAGNSYTVRRGSAITRLRPDWVTIILGSKLEPDQAAGAIDAELAGYLYHPGGPNSGREPVPLLRQQVAHFAPIPDPLATYRGMSWITPVVREIMGDGAATTHKLRFFENGATVNLVVSLDPSIQRETFEKWVEAFKDNHEGAVNAYKTLYLGGGAEAKALGADMRQADFKVTQGHGETRICAAARIPPIVVGLSEGLEAATYSNYGQARRAFADGTMRPLWRNAAGSLATLVNVPVGAELWYDARDIAFLQEDEKDAADIRKVDADAIKALTEAGYEPGSVIDAVTAGDLKRLKHTGVFSVQLQPPGAQSAGSQNGNGNGQPALPAPTE